MPLRPKPLDHLDPEELIVEIIAIAEGGIAAQGADAMAAGVVARDDAIDETDDLHMIGRDAA